MKRLTSFLVALLLIFAGILAYAQSGIGPAVGYGKGHSGVGGGGIAFVDYAHGTTAVTGQTLATSTALTVNSGDAIVCFAFHLDGTADPGSGSVTCGSNNLTHTLTDFSSGEALRVWTISNAAASSSTCTLTVQATVAWRVIACASYSGVATASAVDQSSCYPAGCASRAATSTTFNATNVTTTQANELLVGGVGPYDATGDYTATSPYIQRSADNDGILIVDHIVSSIGTYPSQAIATTGTTSRYRTLFVTLKGQ